MNEFLNVWMPFKFYEALADHLDVPVIFAFIKDGKPSLEMHNPGSRPNCEIDQVMFLKLPLIQKKAPVEEPKEESDDQHVELKVDGDQVTEVVTEETKEEENDREEIRSS